MYRLQLKLPFKVTLVQKDGYATEEDAQAAATLLPGEFRVISEDEIPEDAIQIPLKVSSLTKHG